MSAQHKHWYRRGTTLVGLGVVWALALLALTSFPTALPGEDISFTCLLCGSRGTSDAILNVVLFLPLGALLALAGRTVWYSVIAAAVISGCIEGLQVLIPGRTPTFGDLVFNTLGGATGCWLVAHARTWMAPRGRRADALLFGAALLIPVIVGGTSALTAPAPPPGPYHSEWAAPSVTMAWYRATVLGTDIGGVPLPNGGFSDSDDFRRRLLRGEQISVRAIAGPPVQRFGPLLLIGGWQDTVLMVGPDGDDLVVRYRMRSAELLLDEPELRVIGGYRSIEPGDTILIRLRLIPGGAEVVINDTPPELVGFTPGGGWVLLLSQFVGSRFGSAASAFWAALLLLPIGLWMRRKATTLVAAAVLVVCTYLVLRVAPLLASAPAEWGGAAAGLLAGFGAQRWAKQTGFGVAGAGEQSKEVVDGGI